MFERRYCFALLLCFSIVGGVVAQAAPTEVQQSDPLRDPLTPLNPRRPRTEKQEDAVTAAALYATGRVLYQRQKYAGALRRFQRASRYDPLSGGIMTEAVRVAIELKRFDEATRYALLLVENHSLDPGLLNRLALHLTSQSQFEDALKLYEAAIDSLKDRPANAAVVLTRQEMGRLYFLTGQYKKASESFKIVRKALNDPAAFKINDTIRKLLLDKPHVTYTLMVESFFKADELSDAEECFRKVHAVKPDDALLAFQLARVAHGRDKDDEALKQLDKYFVGKSTAARTDAYELLESLVSAKISNKTKARRELLERLEKIYKQQPDNVLLGYYLGELYLAAEADSDKAESLLKELLEKKARLDGYRGLLGLYHRHGETEKLLDLLGAASLRLSDLDTLGQPYEKLLADEEAAGKLVDAAIHRLAEDGQTATAGVSYVAASIAIKLKRLDDGEKLFSAAAKEQVPGMAGVLLKWGLELFMADESARAAKVFQRAIDEKVVPANNPAFHFYLSGALALSEQTDEALKVAREVAKMNSKDPRFRGREGWVLYRAKRYDEAKEVYGKVVEEFDSQASNPGIREVLHDIRLIMSNISTVQENHGDAVEWLEQVLDEFPNDIGALNDLGYLWATKGEHPERALRMTKAAVAAEPENVAYRDSLAWSLYQLQRYEDAAKELEIVLASDEEPHGEILDHAGDVYLKLNDLKKASRFWKRALASYKEEQDDKAMKRIRAKLKEHKVNKN